jgi:hypothetical protein
MAHAKVTKVHRCSCFLRFLDLFFSTWLVKLSGFNRSLCYRGLPRLARSSYQSSVGLSLETVACAEDFEQWFNVVAFRHEQSQHVDESGHNSAAWSSSGSLLCIRQPGGTLRAASSTQSLQRQTDAGVVQTCCGFSCILLVLNLQLHAGLKPHWRRSG